MPRAKRSRIEIVYDILEALARGPETPTRLATIANLPYDRLARILRDLEEKGIVALDPAPGNPRAREVRLTPKGHELLAHLRRLRHVLRDFGLDLI